MDLHGIGYSNIRLPNDNRSYIYTYNRYINTFPEEVLIHEFLHTLERILKEQNYDIPALHDNEKYGYEEQRLIGLQEWYRDYMRCNIDSEGKKIGLDEIVYSQKPPAKSDFKYSTVKEYHKEPQNVIEEIKGIFFNIGKIFVKQKEQ